MAKPAFNPNQPFEKTDVKPTFDASKPFDTAQADAGPTDPNKSARDFIQSDLIPSHTLATDAAGKVGKFIDTYTGAPTRAAIGAAQNNQNPLSAGWKQFGSNPDLAPSGETLVEKAGIPHGALSKALGIGMDVAASPLILANVPGISGLLGKAAEAGSAFMGQKALSLGRKATGATGKAAEAISDDAIRTALDKKIINFGSSPADIASNAQGAIDAAEAAKSGAMSGPLSGAQVDRNDIYNTIQQRINDLSNNESRIPLASKLDSSLQDIISTAERNGSKIPLSQSEEVRRGFDQSAKWNRPTDATAAEASKILANAYRQAGVDSAISTNPEAGKIFQDAKQLQSHMIPIEEAASSRASTLNQSPLGGLHDVAVAGVAGAPGVVAKRVLFPRLASAGAVSADTLSDLLSANPSGVLGSLLEQVPGRSLGLLQSGRMIGDPELMAIKARALASEKK